jgi:hypothetical protein
MILAITIGVCMEGALALGCLKWALSKSNRTFFSVFFGDALLRLAGLGFVAWWLWSSREPFVGPLLTLAFGYLAVSLAQIPFFYRAR